jgi:hypothetical protein
MKAAVRIALLLAIGTGLARATPPSSSTPAPPAAATNTGDASGPEGRPEVPPPPFTDGIYPCSTCHDSSMAVNRTRRQLKDFHDDIVLKHDERHRWCLDCHDPTVRDSLHLASGERISFDESYRLCGQCHGEKYRDWRAGVHGRRTGLWNGHKQYLLCAHCHNPHQPHFKPLEPRPAPQRPQRPGREEQEEGGHEVHR